MCRRWQGEVSRFGTVQCRSPDGQARELPERMPGVWTGQTVHDGCSRAWLFRVVSLLVSLLVSLPVSLPVSLSRCLVVSLFRSRMTVV